MKIGIMSMQRIINYGSFLQSYGLKKTIENMGHTVEFVDYEVGKPLVSSELSVVNNDSKFKKILKLIFSSKYRKTRKNNLEKSKIFFDFYNTFKSDWLPILGIKDDYNYLPELDVLVIGSDEVFNCTQSNSDVGYSPQLFGYDNKSKKLISYAASFGSTTLEKLNQYGIVNEIAENLSGFNHISVRDDNSHNIVKKLTNIEPVDSIDPVLLYDFFEETKDLEIDLSNYVVVYAYADRISDVEAEEIQKFAHSRGKKTLSIGVKQDFVDLYVKADPFTLLSYIKNADYVVTDTFHGTVFSIKYQIPFVSFIRESNKQKLSDLLSKFNLTHRSVNNASDLEKIMDSDFNKEKIIEYIEKYRNDAKMYLENSIN